MITDYDIIKEINQELGSELTPGEREWLETQRILHQRRVSDITSAAVAAKVRQIRKAFQSNQVDVPKASFSDKDRGGKASQSRMMAISQIVAQYAANDAGVKKFRKEILKGRLLAKDKIEVWINLGSPIEESTSCEVFSEQQGAARRIRVPSSSPERQGDDG